ncbi:homoserine kinase [Piscinibacter koreensis]|uniref:Homoserine kinase n=1 Tax=Piscinibacter koreensis TaxID=2742824 RepID=A0A7Y6NLP2_9BURK|nr:homoserine kinase [Schlegelella koreensis]NUZ05414.1 homoserine kinase [Schlegelella koreensis]
MAVFTEVDFDAAAALIAGLGIGELRELHSVPAGIENTNYFADTTGGRFVLTLFERLARDELPFYLRLMEHLAERGMPVPRPRPDRDGNLVLELHGKPAAVVDRLPGAHHLAPDAADCASLGAMLARMHLAGADFPLQQANLRGLDWCTATAPSVLPFLDPEQRDLLQHELAYQHGVAASAAYAALPRGAIHADLFRDNVLFDDGRLSGIFDFYFAGTDTYGFDIAVAINDWCVDATSGRLLAERADALVGAYESVRPLASAERRLLPALLRAGALRFWVSRLWDLHLPRDAALLKAHDPTHFERVLRARIDEPYHPPASAAA